MDYGSFSYSAYTLTPTLYASKDKVKELKEKLSSCITGKILPTRNQYACYDL